MFLRGLAVATCCLLTACASSSSTPRAARSDRNVILADEIARVGASTALEAVQRLQPRMLEKQRGPSSINLEDQAQINVYVDGARMGGVEALSLIQAPAIVEIRYLSPSEATIRFGTGNAAGAIVVVTRT
jgi:hypothetical protein